MTLEARRDGARSKREIADALDDALDRRRRRRRIRCPKCRWEPDGRPHWQCELCFCVFDTFETGASCPECPNRWRETQCPKCGESSEHDEWYVDETS